MSEKKCLIHQPQGLGDIIWLQPMVSSLIAGGFTVHHPVCDLYYDQVVKHMPRSGVVWHRETDNFPMKAHYGAPGIFWSGEGNTNLYLSMFHASIPKCPPMMAKYAVMRMPLSDWRAEVTIVRDRQREADLLSTYGIDEDTVLVNDMYGTPPASKVAIGMDSQALAGRRKVHRMSFEEDRRRGFTAFDWIGAIEVAAEFHTVYTSLCYFADLFSKPKAGLHMYDRRSHPQQPQEFLWIVSFVHRHPNWTYHL